MAISQLIILLLLAASGAAAAAASGQQERCIRQEDADLAAPEAKYFYYGGRPTPLGIFSTRRTTHRIASTVLKIFAEEVSLFSLFLERLTAIHPHGIDSFLAEEGHHCEAARTLLSWRPDQQPLGDHQVDEPEAEEQQGTHDGQGYHHTRERDVWVPPDAVPK